MPNTLKLIIFISTYFLGFQSAQANTVTPSHFSGISELYSANNLEGILLIESSDGTVQYGHNLSRSSERFSPASTFKIANTLIALEEGIVKTADNSIPWDKIKRSYPPWNQDQTLKSAFSVSCVWCYQKFATAIGHSKYQDYLTLFDYGNKNTGTDITQFWLNGNLTISVKEQIDFLRSIYLEKLPINKKNYSTLRDIMIFEKNDGRTTYGKTGWSGKHGWFVGYIETQEKTWLFAHYLEINDKSSLKYRKELVYKVINDLKLF